MIREAVIADIPEIVRVGRRALAKSLSHAVPVHKPTVFSVFQKFISNPDRLLIVAEHDGEITGVLMMGLEAYWWDDARRGRRYATDWLFYSSRRDDGRKMLRIGTEWAWTRPRVVDVTLGTNIPNHMDMTKKMYTQSGLQHVGHVFYLDNPHLLVGEEYV